MYYVCVCVYICVYVCVCVYCICELACIVYAVAMATNRLVLYVLVANTHYYK